jgi:hypothetical protein
MRLFFVLFALTAAASTAPAQPGPCAVVTKAEVGEALGKPVADGKPNSTNKAVCDFTGEGGSTVGVMLVGKAPGDSAERMVAELKKHKIEAAVVPGLGDGAYSSSPGYGMQQMGAYKGSRHVIVTLMVPGATAAKSKATAEQVIRKALARL